MESDGKSGDSRAHTWSTFNVVIMYVALIVLTSPTLGNAATTVPPFRSTSFSVRISTSTMGPHLARVEASRLSRLCNGAAARRDVSRLPDELEAFERPSGNEGIHPGTVRNALRQHLRHDAARCRSALREFRSVATRPRANPLQRRMSSSSAWVGARRR